MLRNYFFVFCSLFLFTNVCKGQVVRIGTCAQVDTMKYFDLERFLGKWYELERFPTWYESSGMCAYKNIQACGRRIEIEHVYVRDEIQFVLHINSTYTPGDEAVFEIKESNIDPIGIPLSVTITDYSNYAIVYGCKDSAVMDIKYTWILARAPTLPTELLTKARSELNSLPYASVAYLEEVDQREESCSHYWTAHVYAVNVNDTAIKK